MKEEISFFVVLKYSSLVLAFEIFDEKRTISNSPTIVRENKSEKTTVYQPNESSICDDQTHTGKEAEMFVN